MEMNPQDLAAMAPDNLKLEVLLIIQFNTGSKGILGFKKNGYVLYLIFVTFLKPWHKLKLLQHSLFSFSYRFYEAWLKHRELSAALSN